MELGFASSMNKCLGARVDVAVPAGLIRSGDVVTEIGHQEIPKLASTHFEALGRHKTRQSKCLLLLRSTLKRTEKPKQRSPTKTVIGS